MTTHELGHNFGAEHDPEDIPYCAPSEDQGGKYVMYPIAVSGDHVHNKVASAGSSRFSGVHVFLLTASSAVQMFSNCSKRSIVKRLRAKAPSCFRRRNTNVCGNSRVEQGEQCDPGLLHIHLDRCCTADCRLTAGAQCRSETPGRLQGLFCCSATEVKVHLRALCVFSDRNSACCKNCMFAAEGEVCQEPIDATCKGHSYCTGQPAGQRSHMSPRCTAAPRSDRRRCA